MCFYFYFSLLHLKLIFCPLPKGENQLAQLESEGMAQFLRLGPSRLPVAHAGTRLCQVEQALMEMPTNVFVRHPDLGFIQNYTSYQGRLG